MAIVKCVERGKQVGDKSELIWDDDINNINEDTNNQNSIAIAGLIIGLIKIFMYFIVILKIWAY